MTIITLEDGTFYYIDTNDKFTARHVVGHKLRDRHDFRKIKDITVCEELAISSDSIYYNSSDAHDRIPLKCKKGYSYRWPPYDEYNIKFSEFR